ncbi:F-box/FBD/LRR-repeat protein At5g56420-like isoform X1 [Alnus glutinosa]|uniref:F-box/FBD/LRR-repeat protein At5g56420-like isoform X1 n=1 Tax=Alnus glutinosa TaxID=3517 RepID=UPI002D784036|nr:F-box/FBD/LRR-repeat protein At5g56420-like isoform X1 [Alnus glutinosa]
MEKTCLIKEPQKKQKLNEEDQDIDENNKCLGDLPEEILRHILSFLPTKDAVRTSLLSKRWEYLWASIPNLDFGRSFPAKRNLLMNFVERVLCLRDSYAIKQFTLSCDVLHDASRVNRWISAVVRHNVQELYIKLDNFKGKFSLPYCLFTCKTLISLHLRMSYILKLPTTICFSNLKTLTIIKVTFSDEYLTQQFFSGLPVLENLCLKNCSWKGLKFVHLSAPKLHSLSITELKWLNLSYGDGCQIMIFALGLKKFDYFGELFNEYCLYKSFSLERAEINVILDNASAQIAHRMYKLLIGLSNVEVLSLSLEVVEALRDAGERLYHMPMFNNLANLVFFEGSTIDLGCVGLLRILHNSPCLKTMKFSWGISLRENDDWKLDPLPPCFLSHLKWIVVRNYDGDKEEFFAMKILLKNAIVLDEIDIYCSERLAGNLEKQVNLCKQLIEIPKGSQNCEIVFLNPWQDVVKQ